MPAPRESWESHLKRNWKRLAKYPAELCRPLPPMSTTERKNPVKSAQRALEVQHRVSLLVKHLGITSGDAHDLLTALLYLHVPGFRETAAPSGPKVKWTDWTQAELIVAFELEHVRDRYAKDSEIADKLAQRQEWKRRLSRAATDDGRKRSLLTQARAARKRLSEPQFRRMYQFVRTLAACRENIKNWKWNGSRISVEQFEATARQLGFDLNVRSETGRNWFPEFQQRVRAIEQTRS